ncbi:DUF397 domain-containing protein [Amycolatopsis sp. CA-230715]|uniref:DUF397 domain-containing protein n=1 Tax=Amycolatopsis sp. CA-230715 TaxID=2745196 RepID=UPI001C00CBBE|nr:DUF397 domain-containing protein [Amycolatopsis sp. CA-230715]
MSTIEPSAVVWRASSHSGGNGECVEVGTSPVAVLIRDTKQRGGGSLRMDSRPWRAFLAELRADTPTR